MIRNLIRLFRETRIIKGQNNFIEIDKGIFVKLNICGSNNVVRIKYDKNEFNYKTRQKSKFIINIRGNNNTIDIDEISSYNSGKLNIDIGNNIGCDNVDVKIGKSFNVVNARIFAYESNVPITIGDNCLLSWDVVLRTGDLPHIVYDEITKSKFPISSGIKIGNHVWIGQNTFIMKHAKICDNSIVASGTVVTKKFDETNVVLGGNPAKICKENINWALTEKQYEEILQIEKGK